MIISFQSCAVVRYQKLKSLTASRLNLSKFWGKNTNLEEKNIHLAGRSELFLCMYDYVKWIMGWQLVVLIPSIRKVTPEIPSNLPVLLF